MEATNCPSCGKFFMKTNSPICADCAKEVEESFDNVRAYVKDNPNSSIKAVSDACNVSVKRILQYIREGRLEASVGMQNDVTCSKCGKPISTGRICPKCLAEMGQQIASSKSVEQKKGNHKDDLRMFTRS